MLVKIEFTVGRRLSNSRRKVSGEGEAIVSFISVVVCNRIYPGGSLRR